MPKGLYIKSAIGFSPYDDDARAMEAKVPAGSVVELSRSSVLSGQQNKLFHALCKIVYDNTEKFAGADEVKDSCKMAVGHTRTTHVKYQGEWFERKVPRSITEFDHDGFNDFVSRAIDYFATELGVDKQILLNEVPR